MKTSRLRKYRKINRLTLVDMARDLGISYVHLSMLERNKRKPSIELMYHIAKITNNYVSPWDWKGNN